MDRLKITHESLAALEPRATNPRTHSKKQIRQIAESIKAFGFTNPVLVDAAGGIIAGHGRVAAAQLLGLETVPTIRLEELSEAQIRAYVIADNRLAELAGWDDRLLALELQGQCQSKINYFDQTSERYLATVDFPRFFEPSRAVLHRPQVFRFLL